jgi:hypothetical protein
MVVLKPGSWEKKLAWKKIIFCQHTQIPDYIYIINSSSDAMPAGSVTEVMLHQDLPAMRSVTITIGKRTLKTGRDLYLKISK